jgi:hypothetical protein
MRTFNNIQINKRDTIREELLSNYNKQEINKQESFQLKNESCESFLFDTNIEIYKNGQKIQKNDYYKDCNLKINNLNNRQPIVESNEPVEQVDPNSFFNSSLNGLFI